MLSRCGMGFGAVALADLMKQAGLMDQSVAEAANYVSPLSPKQPHFPAKVRHVIHIFLNGGCSQVDTFDPKPKLEEYAGKNLPMPNLPTERKTGAAFPSPYKFQKYGESGIEVSEIFANVGSVIDDFCVIRSMHADVPNHEPSLLLMNCGEARLVRPSMGSWLTYGLGTENQNLPAFIAMCPGGYPIQESQNWQAGFLPGIYQGTYIDTKHTDIEKLIEHVRNNHVAPTEQRRQLDLLQQLNARHAAERSNDPQLEARIHSFELAYRMQKEAADAFDVNLRAQVHPRHVRPRHAGAADSDRPAAGRARRAVRASLARRRSAVGQPRRHRGQPPAAWRSECDQAIAALIKDLKQRGLFEETLVIWAAANSAARRRSNCRRPVRTPAKSTAATTIIMASRCWLAGGGVRGGLRARRNRRIRLPGGRKEGPRA